MDQPAVLSLTRLDKSYGRIRALSEVSLEIGPGEFVALVGTAGAGKSTLIHLIAGLASPDAGRIAILGRDSAHHPVAARAATGVVFAGSTLDFDQSVSGNLDYQASLCGLDRSSARNFADELLSALGASGLAADRVRSLSLANRRRVELARALLHQPALLVADAVDPALDLQSRRELLADLLRTRRADTALLWATDDPEDAEEADRIVVLQRGHILFDGAPATLLAEQGAGNLTAAFARLAGQKAT